MKQGNKRICIVFCLLTMWFWPIGCDNSGNGEVAEEGKVLSQSYCVACHQVPEPDLLPRSVWEGHVLPLMGAMLGQYPADTGRYSRSELLGLGAEREARLAANTFPAQAVLSNEAWEAIQAYYLQEAPVTLPDTPALKLSSNLELFHAQRPSHRLSPPSTTLLQFGSRGGLYLGDANTQRLYVLNSSGEVQGAANVREGAVDLIETPQALFLTVMGSFSPTEVPSGFFMQLPTAGNAPPKVLIPNLQRPVHSQVADLNGDGLTDVLVCEFGKWTGGLHLHIQQGDGTFDKKVLRTRSGATRAYLLDQDEDGDLDILALMAQGDEGIFYYENQGEGQFREQRVLQFPPSYGSSYFSLYDFDADGKLDILYVNGDNADYAPVTKGYHGIRIYLHGDDLDFQLAKFLPLPGAYKAIPADYDQDGDIDLAAISFFPDYEQTDGAESFVFFENEGEWNFSAYTFPQANQGRWLTMTVGDPDQDGDLDLALGSLTFEVPGDTARTNGWARGGLPYLVLENQLK